MRPGVLVLLKTVARLWAAEDLYVALAGRRGVLHRRRCPLQWYSAQTHISRPRADIEKMDYVQRLRVKDESSRVFRGDRKSTRLNSSHANISYAVFCLKKKTPRSTTITTRTTDNTSLAADH